MDSSGIVPRSETSLLLFYDNWVSASDNASGRDILLRSFFVALEPAGVLVMNGDGVSGILGDGGEGRRTSWIGALLALRLDRSRLGGGTPTDQDC